MGQKLGWDKVPGTRYAISCSPDFVTLTSTGAGHGVGLCQWGACGLARLGKSYLEILRYYFPGTDVRRPGSQAASDQH
jgi:stage II sporulation protein D